MGKRRSIETAAFSLFTSTIFLSSPTLAIDARASVDVRGTTISGGVSVTDVGVSAGATVSTGDDGLSAGATVSTDDNSIPAAGSLPSSVVEPPQASHGQVIIALPAALAPTQLCANGDSAHCPANAPEGRDLEGLTPEFSATIAALTAGTGVPTDIIAACRKGILSGAEAYDPVQVDVAGAGSVQRGEGGGQIAPLIVRIVYNRQGGHEIREARVSCHVDALGNAVALT